LKSIGSFSEIFLHKHPVDGRKQINGLAQIVKSYIEKDLFGSILFVFINKRLDVVKLLYWDRTGFAMWVKRLEEDRFRWPTLADNDVVLLSEKELKWLLDGINILINRPHKTLEYSEVQ